VRGEIDPEHAKANERMFEEQLKRDTYFKEVVPMGRGRYRVRYENAGKFGPQNPMVTFVSRREPIFRVLITKDGNVEVNGSGRAATYAKNFEAVGIKSQGLFRITTDAEVISQNAGFSRASATPGYTMYDWRRRDLTDPPPRFVARLAVDPRTGIPAYRGSDGLDPK
jgi:hypothetical protein